MNLKSILDRINLVTRSRFAANANQAWLLWAKDILLEIDGIHAGPGRVVRAGVKVSSTGAIDVPPGIDGILDVLVDGERVDYQINRHGIKITDEDCSPSSSVGGVLLWTQEGFSGTTPDQTVLRPDNALAGMTITTGYSFATVVSSKYDGIKVSFETDRVVSTKDSVSAKYYTTNTYIVGYERTKAPASVDEELDIEDDWASMLTAGIWYMAENDMDPSGPDARMRLANYERLKRAYIASMNFAPGKTKKRSFQFTPKRNR